MSTIQLENEITAEQYQMVVQLLKAVGIKVKKQEKDDTLMSKKAFFDKIDKARKEKASPMRREELRKILLSAYGHYDDK